jgi:hypothetical protein
MKSGGSDPSPSNNNPATQKPTNNPRLVLRAINDGEKNVGVRAKRSTMSVAAITIGYVTATSESSTTTVTTAAAAAPAHEAARVDRRAATDCTRREAERPAARG